MDEFKIIILVVHDKRDNCFWKNTERSYPQGEKHLKAKVGLNLKLQLIMKKKIRTIYR